MFKAILIFLSLLMFPAMSFSYEWDKKDIALETVVAGLYVVDWNQTKRLHSQGFEEKNPWMGKNPSESTINTNMGSYMIGHAIISNYLPDVMIALGYSEKTAKLSRTVWQYIFIATESAVVYHNYQIGIRTNF